MIVVGLFFAIVGISWMVGFMHGKLHQTEQDLRRLTALREFNE